MARLQQAAVAPLGRRISPAVRRNVVNGLLFTLPWIIGILAFRAYPILAALSYSFTDYRGMMAAKFIGLDNYVQLLTKDTEFWTGVLNTLIYTAMALPSAILTALVTAVMLNAKIRGQAFYRTLYFLPVLVPDVALSIIWLQMFNPQFGLINALIESMAAVFGLQVVGPGWLASEYWCKPTLVLMNMWLIGNAMVIYLAALQDVPQDLLDAASIDGANWHQRLLHITVPMITPVIFFQLVTGLIGSLQLFTQPYVMTGGQGTPANSMMFYSMLLYRQAFVYFNMGRATAMAWMLFLAIVALTYIVFRSSARWVYYGGEDRR